MPQMMPINWMLYFFLFILLFILFNIMNYYIYHFNLNKFKTYKKINMSNFNWKW